MADIIKYISSFSVDAVHIAIEQAVGCEKDKFIDMLKTVQSFLDKPPEKQKKEVKMFHQSDKAIFELKILPQIDEKLAEYDRLEMLGKDCEWKVCFNFHVDYKSLNMNELKRQHAMILEEENNLARLDLVIKYYWGLVYFRARELLKVNETVKAMFRTEFGVCYTTAMRYMTFAALVKRYPRLMACGLSYAQITKHQKRLLDYLKTDTRLHDRLSQPLNVSAQGKDVEIQPSDICVPKTTYNIDPDYLYDDNVSCDDMPESEEHARWLNETASSGEMFNASYLDDDTELLQELEKVNINWIARQLQDVDYK
jgi:hypothetical protein